MRKILYNVMRFDERLSVDEAEVGLEDLVQCLADIMYLHDSEKYANAGNNFGIITNQL